MKRMWQKAFGTAALGLMLAVPLSGCLARPAPRRGPGQLNTSAAIDPSLNAAVATTAAAVGGAGATEAVVMGNLALVAIQLNAAKPGGTEGDTVSGKINTTHQVPSPGGGPAYLQGPGGSTGTSPGTPGGGFSPGGATPGGSPSSTQAIPNNTGGQATQGTSGTNAPASVPSANGAAPMDVMNRVADQIKAKHRSIAEVRFTTRPEDALRLAEIAKGLRQGGNTAAYTNELSQIAGRAIPAGTTEFRGPYPPEGQGHRKGD